MEPRIFVLIGIVTCSWIVTSYYDYAIQRGLPIGSFFLPENGKGFKVFSIIAGLYFTVAGAIDFSWFYFLIIPIVSSIVTFGLTRLLGKHVQLVGVVGIVFLVIVNILMQVEIVSS
jgi:hypothetical protein